MEKDFTQAVRGWIRVSGRSAQSDQFGLLQVHYKSSMDEDLNSLLNGLSNFYLSVSYYQKVIMVGKKLDSEESQPHYEMG